MSAQETVSPSMPHKMRTHLAPKCAATCLSWPHVRTCSPSIPSVTPEHCPLCIKNVHVYPSTLPIPTFIQGTTPPALPVKRPQLTPACAHLLSAPPSVLRCASPLHASAPPQASHACACSLEVRCTRRPGCS